MTEVMPQTGSEQAPTRRRRRPGMQPGRARASTRPTAYHHLEHPFAPQAAFSDDQIAAMHQTALRVLKELGIRVLLDEGRALLKAAGAIVDEDSQMVRVGPEIVEHALSTTPRRFTLRAPSPHRDQQIEAGRLLFTAGSGCPNVYDRTRGRRPGTLADFEETLKLQQSFDALHKLGPSAEPQDVPVEFRHYATMAAQIGLCDKPVFIYARGRRQVEEGFEMIRLANALDQDAFLADVWATTVINSNSPRQFDRPMAQGIIDFARAGQMSIITPFCLAGAMAPVTVAGALTLQHAEALFGITLAQYARAGAPVCYGAFSSNVDMKSGAPAFGTPEQIRASLGSGQLARHVGLPWRSAAGSAGNCADGQGTQENAMALWGAVLGNATFVLHAAGWLEGGLTFGYEKFILDMEAVQTIAELCAPAKADAAAFGFDAIEEVSPGGHFFAAAHTMARYQDAFYTPLAANLSNHGAWVEAGSKTAEERATAIWRAVLDRYEPPAGCDERRERMAAFIAKRQAAGGASPLD